MHGLVLDQRWDVLEENDRRAQIRCRLEPPWPWDGSVTADYHLSPGQLDVTLTVATDRDEFPASAGWHPWFHRHLSGGAPVHVELPHAGLLPRGEDHLPRGNSLVPPGRGPFDDCFHVPAQVATLTWAGALSLTCTSTTPWFVLYDELDDAVCLEPQTHPPDALRTADPVTKNRPLTLRTIWSWSTADTAEE
jgi:aldose 1-epimerase